MSGSPWRGAPVVVRLGAVVVDLTVAAVTTVLFLAIGFATGVRSPWPYTIPAALLLGGLMFFRKRWPMAVLLLSAATLFGYHLISPSPAGSIWPIAAAYFSVATTRHYPWAIGIGVVQLVYLAIDDRWILDINVRPYLLYTLGEALLLAIVIGAGLAHAAAQRWRSERAGA